MPYMYGYHWLWAVIGLGFWLLVLVGIFFIIRALVAKRDGGEKVEKSALDILNERYARGEITRDEYNEKKRDILGKYARLA